MGSEEGRWLNTPETEAAQPPRQGALRLEGGARERNQPPKPFWKIMQSQLVIMLRARRSHWRLSLDKTAS